MRLAGIESLPLGYLLTRTSVLKRGTDMGMGNLFVRSFRHITHRDCVYVWLVGI